MRVLIADDDPVSRRLLEVTLHGWNYDVLTVADGREALATLQGDNPPRLAILDWMMPGMDGPQVCRELRSSQPRQYTYIILLTSRGDKSDIARGLEAGADDYVVKPFEKIELRARLLAGKRIIELEQELLDTQEKLRHQATHDSLTGVWNRAAILEKLEVEIQRARRQNTPVTIVMADVDQFKAINDTYGHQVGDMILRSIAQNMNSAIRVYDAVGRYGGEEFLVVLPGCDRITAHSLSQRLYVQVRQHHSFPDKPPLFVTCSFGVATTQDACADSEKLIRLADDALFRAKAAGRDRITVVD